MLSFQVQCFTQRRSEMYRDDILLCPPDLQANFASEQSGGATETEGVKKLKQICAELSSLPGAVKDLLAALQDESSEKISTYEFLSSGAVQGLKAYLQGEAIGANLGP